MRIKILCVPVYRNKWLFHSWYLDAPNSAIIEFGSWKTGKTFADKAYLFRQEVSHKVSVAAKSQWSKLQTAKEGTFKHKLYRLSNYVLEQEDPIETFLKTVPSDASKLQILYPASVTEDDLRSLILRVGEQRTTFHWSRGIAWGLVCLPQLPFLATPLPSVPLYFSMYRCLSHVQAARGGAKLVDALRIPGGGGNGGASPHQPGHRADAEATLSDAVEKGAGDVSMKPLCQAAAPVGDTDSHPEFLPSPALDEMCRPADRWVSPLSAAAARRVAQLTQQEDVMTLLGRLRRRLGFAQEEDEAPVENNEPKNS